MPATRDRRTMDRLWERVRPLLPPPAPKPRGGRPRADDRAGSGGIAHVLRAGCRWQDLPDRSPSAATCWRRHRDWAEAGVRDLAWCAVLDELAARGRVEADATFVPAAKGGTGSAPPRSARA